jgi:hypothetical protein
MFMYVHLILKPRPSESYTVKSTDISNPIQINNIEKIGRIQRNWHMIIVPCDGTIFADDLHIVLVQEYYFARS